MYFTSMLLLPGQKYLVFSVCWADTFRAGLLLIQAEMQTVMTSRLLTHLCDEINSGRPLWALLWANRYLSAQDPLRLTLARKANAKIELDHKHKRLSAAVLQTILDGKTLLDLSDHERAEIIACRESPDKISTRIISGKFMPAFSFRSRRQATALERRSLYSRVSARLSRPRFQVRYATPRRAHMHWSAE